MCLLVNMNESKSPAALSRAHAGPHQVDVTELIQPEGVDGRCDAGEVVGLEACGAASHRRRQPGQDPAVHRTLLPAQLCPEAQPVST